MAMGGGGLLSPKPVSYLQQQQQQHQQHYGGFSRGPATASSYSATPPLPSGGNQYVSVLNVDDGTIYKLVVDLLEPSTREGALLDLSKKREQYDDLALVLWYSFGMWVRMSEGGSCLLIPCCSGIMPVLLQEIVLVYPLLSPPNLTAHASNRVCNALALLQCVASHTETRQLFLNGKLLTSMPFWMPLTDLICSPCTPVLIPLLEYYVEDASFRVSPAHFPGGYWGPSQGKRTPLYQREN